MFDFVRIVYILLLRQLVIFSENSLSVPFARYINRAVYYRGTHNWWFAIFATQSVVRGARFKSQGSLQCELHIDRGQIRLNLG